MLCKITAFQVRQGKKLQIPNNIKWPVKVNIFVNTCTKYYFILKMSNSECVEI